MMGPDPGVGRGGDAVQHGAAPFTSPEVHVGAPFGTPPVVPRWYARARLQALTLVWVVSVATLLAVGPVESLTHVNVMGKGLVNLTHVNIMGNNSTQRWHGAHGDRMRKPAAVKPKPRWAPPHVSL